MNVCSQDERGFVALTSVLVMAAVLLVALGSAGLVSFYARFNALDFELKERSRAAADACAAAALVRLAGSGSPDGMTLTLNTLDECRVGYADMTMRAFRVQATSSGVVVTNLLIGFDPLDFSVVSYREMAIF